MRPLVVLSATLAFPLLVPALGAQDGPAGAGTTMPRGARVRITAPGLPKRLEARIDTVRNDTLHLRAGETGFAVAVPLLQVRRVEVPDGQASRLPRAAAGASLGAVAGGIVGYQVALVLQKLYPDCADCEFEPLPSERREWLAEDRRLRWAWAAGVGAAVGTVGAMMGRNRSPGERWRDTGLPVRVTLEPSRTGGAMFGIAMRFQ